MGDDYVYVLILIVVYVNLVYCSYFIIVKYLFCIENFVGFIVKKIKMF